MTSRSKIPANIPWVKSSPGENRLSSSHMPTPFPHFKMPPTQLRDNNCPAIIDIQLIKIDSGQVMIMYYASLGTTWICKTFSVLIESRSLQLLLLAFGNNSALSCSVINTFFSTLISWGMVLSVLQKEQREEEKGKETENRDTIITRTLSIFRHQLSSHGSLGTISKQQQAAYSLCQQRTGCCGPVAQPWSSLHSQGWGAATAGMIECRQPAAASWSPQATATAG